VQGYIYDKKLVVKPGPAPGFYRLCPPKHRPRSVCTYLDDHLTMDVYTYAYVEGRQAGLLDIASILDVCGQAIWRPTGMMLPQEYKNVYVKHVLNVIQNHPNFEGYDENSGPVIEEALKLILTAELPLVVNVHGDLTFENIIIEADGNVVFIDPGETHGAHTPALDRGKLLQSFVMRWEQRLNGSNPPVVIERFNHAPWLGPNSWPLWADELDWAFLVTHWARLVRHWPEYDIMSGFKTLREVKP
jgi:hypothetical protein